MLQLYLWINNLALTPINMWSSKAVLAWQVRGGPDLGFWYLIRDAGHGPIEIWGWEQEEETLVFCVLIN